MKMIKKRASALRENFNSHFFLFSLFRASRVILVYWNAVGHFGFIFCRFDQF